MSIRKKLLIIAVVVLTLVILFKIYSYEIFVWSCEQEKVASSCMLAGKEMEEKSAFVSAERHYLESCRLDYGIGCFYLANLYFNKGQVKQAEKFYNRACKLEYTNACKK